LVNSPSAARQAGQASSATIKRTRLTRSFAWRWRSATAVAEWTAKSAPHWMQVSAVSGDWARQTVQLRKPASSRPRADCNVAPRGVNLVSRSGDKLTRAFELGKDRARGWPSTRKAPPLGTTDTRNQVIYGTGHSSGADGGQGGPKLLGDVPELPGVRKDFENRTVEAEGSKRIRGRPPVAILSIIAGP